MGGNPSRVRVIGPLEEFASGFAVELVRIGYTPNATADQLRLLAHLSRWLAAEGLDTIEITPTVLDTFLAARRANGYTLWLSRKALRPLLEYLRELGATPSEPVVASSASPASCHCTLPHSRPSTLISNGVTSCFCGQRHRACSSLRRVPGCCTAM